jgi:hypothetical protein
MEWINNNTFDCETTGSVFNTSSLVQGEFAVINQGFGTGGSPTILEQLQFANNTVNNYLTGYFHDFKEIYNTASASSYWYNNTISSYTTSIAPNNSVAYGLRLSSSDGLTYTAVPQNAMSVEANTFTKATHNAITVTNVGSGSTNGGLTIINNTELGVAYNSSWTTLQSPPVAAVYLTGCKYVKVTDNYNIKCTGLSSYASTDAHYIHGIYVSQSTNMKVNCNTVNYMGEGYVWEGTCTGSNWYRNTVQHSRFGLVLRSSGTMGDQGSTGSPIGDTWGKFVSTDITDAQTLCDASDPHSSPTSKLYCLASTCSLTTTPLPCQNNATGTGGFAYSTSSTPVTLISTTGPTPQVCIGEIGGRMMGSTTSDSTSAGSSLAELVNGIESGAPLPVYDAETRWAVQYYVSSMDSTIDAAVDYNNAKIMAMADLALANHDFVAATNLNNSIIPSNTIENNWQQVTAILLRKVSDSTYQYTESDISTLDGIAAQCPLSGGSVVYKARAIVTSYYGAIVEYPNTCPDNMAQNDQTRTTTITQISDGKNRISLYPNPNNGTMMVEYSIKDDASLEITDLSGKLVGKYKLISTDSKTEIKNDKLENGIYLYRIITSAGTQLKTGKIAVIK